LRGWRNLAVRKRRRPGNTKGELCGGDNKAGRGGEQVW